MKFFLFCLLLIAFTANAQSRWKSYRLTPKGDTINCIDNNDLRQGRWSIKIPELRGEPGHDEEGMYRDGKKEGVWRSYTTMGDMYAIENNRWGNKEGMCQYYNTNGMT